MFPDWLFLPHIRPLLLKTGHEHTTVIQAGVNLNRFKLETTHVHHGVPWKVGPPRLWPALCWPKKHEMRALRSTQCSSEKRLLYLQRLAGGGAFIRAHDDGTRDACLLAWDVSPRAAALPKRTAWMLASPLKRSEFLASGLPVFGIDHQGHRLAGVDSAWFTLAAQEDFHADGLEVLRRHMDANGQHSAAARAYAETNLGWSISVDALMRVLSDLNQSES